MIIRHAPTSLSWYINSLTKNKFIPTGKTFPQLKGKAVQIRSMTEPILALWCVVKSNTRGDNLLKMVLQRSKEYDEIVQGRPDLPCLPPDVSRSPKHMYNFCRLNVAYTHTHIYIYFVAELILQTLKATLSALQTYANRSISSKPTISPIFSIHLQIPQSLETLQSCQTKVAGALEKTALEFV